MGWRMNSTNMRTSKLDKYTVLDTVFNITVKINLVFRTAVQGNKNYFDLVGGSSYQEFELLRVKL